MEQARRRTMLLNVGPALYGERWQAELAGHLGVSDRTVRRWYAGEKPIPARAVYEMQAAMIARAGLLRDLLKAVEPVVRVAFAERDEALRKRQARAAGAR